MNRILSSHDFHVKILSLGIIDLWIKILLTFINKLISLIKIFFW